MYRLCVGSIVMLGTILSEACLHSASAACDFDGNARICADGMKNISLELDKNSSWQAYLQSIQFVLAFQFRRHNRVQQKSRQNYQTGIHLVTMTNIHRHAPHPQGTHFGKLARRPPAQLDRGTNLSHVPQVEYVPRVEYLYHTLMQGTLTKAHGPVQSTVRS